MSTPKALLDLVEMLNTMTETGGFVQGKKNPTRIRLTSRRAAEGDHRARLLTQKVRVLVQKFPNFVPTEPIQLSAFVSIIVPPITRKGRVLMPYKGPEQEGDITDLVHRTKEALSHVEGNEKQGACCTK